MSFTILQKQDLNSFVRKLMLDYRVVGPIADNGGFAFEVITDPAELRLDYPTTILPPKKYLLPVRETLFRFDHNQGFRSLHALIHRPCCWGCTPVICTVFNCWTGSSTAATSIRTI